MKDSRDPAPDQSRHDLSGHDRSADSGPDMLRTDSRQQRNVWWLIAAMATAAVLLWLLVLPALKRWINVSDIGVMTHRMGAVYYGLSALLFITAGYAVWYARRIFRSSQFPPPGSWVLRDTRLLRGDHARARGWWVVACAASLSLIAIYVAILPAYISAQLLRSSVEHAAVLASPHG